MNVSSAMQSAGYFIGPLLAALLAVISVHVGSIGDLVINSDTLPGWGMAILWFLYMLVHFLIYKVRFENRYLSHSQTTHSLALHTTNVRDNTSLELKEPPRLRTTVKADAEEGGGERETEKPPLSSLNWLAIATVAMGYTGEDGSLLCVCDIIFSFNHTLTAFTER